MEGHKVECGAMIMAVYTKGSGLGFKGLRFKGLGFRVRFRVLRGKAH